MKTRKKDYENKQKIIIENYLTNKKNIQRESMEETDFIMCLKKINKDLKNTEKIIVKQKFSINKFIFFVNIIKMEQKALVFDKQCINKNVFHEHKHLIDIDKVDVDRIVIFSKDSYGKKGSFKYFF